MPNGHVSSAENKMDWRKRPVWVFILRELPDFALGLLRFIVFVSVMVTVLAVSGFQISANTNPNSINLITVIVVGYTCLSVIDRMRNSLRRHS